MIYKILNKQIKIGKNTLIGTSYEHSGIDHPFLYEFVYNEMRNFNENDIFIDIGANIGLFSLMIEKGKAIAFEPVPDTFVKLILNCSRNKEKNIHCINLALYSEENPFNVVYNELNGCNKIDIIKEGEWITSTLDIWCQNNLNENENIRMIKIDTEGTDFEVLKGAENIIDKFHPIIIIEVNKCSKDEVSNFLKRKGYKIDDSDSNDWIAK